MLKNIGSKYTKILINNVPIQPIVSGKFPIGAQLPIAQAERIEIVYESSSADIWSSCDGERKTSLHKLLRNQKVASFFG